jgi:hypothetical protein
MMQLAGILVVLVAAIWMAADAHGAEMGKQAMIDPSGIKLLAILAKYPLAVAAVVGSIVGASVVAAYQKKDRLKQVLINASVSITLTPGVFAFTGTEPTWDRWLACALVLGVVSGGLLKIWVDAEVQSAIRHGVAHQISKRLGSQAKDKPE